MTDDALLQSAVTKSTTALRYLQAIHEIGRTQPVPAALFAEVRRELTVALANVNELERRARGMPAPEIGGLPKADEPRNKV